MLVLLLLLREDDARNVCLLSVTEKTRKNGKNVIIPRSSRYVVHAAGVTELKRRGGRSGRRDRVLGKMMVR